MSSPLGHVVIVHIERLFVDGGCSDFTGYPTRAHTTSTCAYLSSSTSTDKEEE